MDGIRQTASGGLQVDRFREGRVFYKKTRGGENVGKLYFREGWNGEEQLLYDPSTYKVGVATVIQNSLPSWDGEHVVLGLTASGAEWSELRVLNVSRRSLLPDSIYPSFGAFSWTPDNQSFLYDGGNVTDIKSLDIQLNRKTRLHKIGTPVQADIDIFSNESHPDLKIAPEGLPIAGVDESYPRYVFGHVRTAQNEGRLFYASTSELRDPSIKWNELCRLSDNIIVWGWEPYGDYLYAITHTVRRNARWFARGWSILIGSMPRSSCPRRKTRSSRRPKASVTCLSSIPMGSMGESSNVIWPPASTPT